MPTTEKTASAHGQAAVAHHAGTRSDLATSKIFFFVAALLSLAASIYLFFGGQRIEGVFVGLWVPSILSAGALLIAGRRHE